MKCLRWRLTILLATTALALGVGCDDGKPSVDTSKREATVSGIVSVRGKPATGGNILFNASNSERIVPYKTAPIGPDGSYKVTTFTGGNKVSFDGEIAAKTMGVGLIQEYFDVKPGVENKADFDLMGAGAAQSPTMTIPEKGASKKGR
jgi:hypothetical protein